MLEDDIMSDWDTFLTKTQLYRTVKYHRENGNELRRLFQSHLEF